MKTLLRKKFVLAVFCLLVLPATALADGTVVGPCGQAFIGATNQIFGPCALPSSFTTPSPGGGSGSYGAQAIFGVNSFMLINSPMVASGGPGQVNVFGLHMHSGPISQIWTVPGPVLTQLSLNGMVNILEPGASVNVEFSGMLGEGSPPLRIVANFTESTVFSVTVFGNQPLFGFDEETGEFNIPGVAVSLLTVTINGAASFTGNGEFESAIPEPATVFLLGTGLAGVAIKTRKKLKSRKSKQRSQ